MKMIAGYSVVEVASLDELSSDVRGVIVEEGDASR